MHHAAYPATSAAVQKKVYYTDKRVNLLKKKKKNGHSIQFIELFTMFIIRTAVYCNKIL